MARNVNRLSARSVESCKEPGRHWDGGGLFLSVGKPPTGTDPAAGATLPKKWMYRYRVGSKVRDIGLGSVAGVTLAEARDAASQCRSLLAKGLDPIEHRRSEKSKRTGFTFRQAAEELHSGKKGGWRNAKHAAQWINSLEQHAAPIMAKAVAEVSVADVSAVLQPIWSRLPETASRLRGRIEEVLDAAKVRGHIPEDRSNPARWKGHLQHILGKHDKALRGHFRALRFAEVPGFMTALRDRKSVDAYCLEFLILTASRSGETIGARWAEIDANQQLWVIPATRMKAKVEHRVPLSDRAMEILALMTAMRPDLETDGYVFPGRRAGKPLSGMALEMLLRRMKVDATPHGFRSSFRDWAGDLTTFPREIAEGALAHVIGNKVEAAYRRSDALDRRRELMVAWARFCVGERSGNVVPMPTRAGA